MAFKGVCFYRVFFALLVSFVPCLPSTAAGVTPYPTRTTARPLRAMLVSTSALRQTTTKPKTIPSSTSKPTTISPRFGTIPVAKTPGPRLPETKPHNTYHSTARETKHSTKPTTHRLRAMPSSTSDFRQTTTKLRTIPSSTSTPTTTLRKSHRLYVGQILVYGYDKWTLLVEVEMRIQSFENKCMRRLLRMSKYSTTFCHT